MNDDDERAVNKDELIDDIYRAQVDLQILADWVAHKARPQISTALLFSFYLFRSHLDGMTPSHDRH